MPCERVRTMLKRRLAQLRRESGAVTPAPVPAAPAPAPAQAPAAPAAPGETAKQDAPATASLGERLRRHGRTASGGVARRAPADEQLAAELGAEVVAPGLLRVDSRFPLNGRHGRSALAGLGEPCRHLPLPADPAPRRLLFFDTETTGLSGGVGTLAFMVGLARVDGDALWVRQLMLTALAAEGAMLEQAGAWGDGADAGVSYNGLSFDLPLLAGRCRLTGVADRFSAPPQIDLLHPVRRAFARPWGECRLATVEQRLLGFRRRDDLPGAEAPAAWLAFLQRGDAGRLGAVLRHNCWDLLSLAALLPALDEVYRQPAAHAADLGAIARAWVRCGQPGRALDLLEPQRSRLDARERHELARLYRGRGCWTQACELWEPLAAQGDTAALEALAKYYEHQHRDLRRALELAQRLPPSPQRDRRCQRLYRRLHQSGQRACGADSLPLGEPGLAD